MNTNDFTAILITKDGFIRQINVVNLLWLGIDVTKTTMFPIFNLIIVISVGKLILGFFNVGRGK